MTVEKTILVGAHTSAAGGAYKALLQGASIGANTIQLFTANQKTWEGKALSKEDIELWNEAKEKTGISVTMSHDSYLINLGSPNPELLEKSRTAFRKELERCHLLDVTYLNFHPGAATTDTKEACLDRIVESLLEIAPLAKKGKTKLLLETTAGQGSSVGSTFEEIGYIVKKVKDHLPIGVCIDTCHIFSAGYDIRTKEGWDKTLDDFEKAIGLNFLYALHVNDSLQPFACKKDRHAPLGTGEIGIECFKVIMTNPKLKYLPKYLETPNPEIWDQEISTLRAFAKGEKHATNSL